MDGKWTKHFSNFLADFVFIFHKMNVNVHYELRYDSISWIMVKTPRSGMIKSHINFQVKLRRIICLQSRVIIWPLQTLELSRMPFSKIKKGVLVFLTWCSLLSVAHNSTSLLVLKAMKEDEVSPECHYIMLTYARY